MKKIKYNALISWIIILFILCPQINYSQLSRNIKPGASKDVIQQRDNKAQNPHYSETDYNKVDRKKKYLDKYKRDYNDSENYFRVDKSKNSLWDGKHWKESDIPLRVYVKPISSKYFKKKYTDFTSYALNHWSKADSRLEFVETNSVTNADIVIRFVNNLMEKYDENYLGLTEYEMNQDNHILFADIQISLLKFDNKPVTDGEIKATIIHELGHALGLGHSDDEKDIMFSIISTESDPEMNYNDLSEGDKLAIRDVVSLGFKNKYVRR